MIPTSAGSQPSAVPSKPVSQFVADFIEKLKQERQPGPGDIALKGETGQAIKDNPQYYS